MTARGDAPAGPAVEPRGAPSRGRSSAAVGAAVALAVVVLAGALRLWRVRESYELFIDEVTYAEISRTVALGQGVLLYGEPFFLHPPALFGTLALAMTWIGIDADIAAQVVALRPVPAAIGALTPGLVALLVHRVTRSTAAAAAVGVLLALEPFLIRFDSRVLLEAQAMAAAAAGFLVLHIVVERERRGRSAVVAAVAAGLLLLVSLLTKETYAFVGVLPVAGLLVAGTPVRRGTSGLVLGTALAGYAAYVLALVFAGQAGEWFAQKTRGVSRLLGLTQITGFNQEGGVGLVERVLANLASFAVTYAVIGLGLLALAWLVLRLRRDDVPHDVRPGVVLLVAWSAGATAHLAYAVTLGTLEEQMFYLLVVTAVPLVATAGVLLVRPGEPAARHRSGRRSPALGRRLGAALVAALVIAVGVDAVVWWRVHTVPDDAYGRFLAWATVELPQGSTLAVTDETTQFVLREVRVGRWETGAELRDNDVEYVLLVSELVRQGYSDVDEEFLRIAEQGPVVFRSEGRSLGVITVRDIRGATG
ncbi:phospholipid carrier-dependent glycosyltransferase [Pseudonocardia broussonetiae]|uniref:Polyprenol-phosphate-mannose--protein mannosyltransferase n=1 Tax=Pseudonocardia broussonetiae TaxID=2736640 RepID=A0A6M6JQY0_9PSEU|nr:phospholipid carrier-dependent glycosyltransferase [Pseudonocardia broussonetiae]QJY49042.1 phospholipid carrier-dependent glycosyltransferase [Pseudonocardia broussonetiae]